MSENEVEIQSPSDVNTSDDVMPKKKAVAKREKPVAAAKKTTSKKGVAKKSAKPAAKAKKGKTSAVRGPYGPVGSKERTVSKIVEMLRRRKTRSADFGQIQSSLGCTYPLAYMAVKRLHAKGAVKIDTKSRPFVVSLTKKAG